MADKARIAELASKLLEYRDAYYSGEPLVEDDVYDALEDELRRLDPEHDVLTSVGAAPTSTKWEKTSHRAPMYSLNKVNSIPELIEWVKKVGLEVCGDARGAESLALSWSEKLDGISISLVYEEGHLVSAVTRGDGTVGENILPNVVMMRGVQRTLKHPLTGWVRGEIVLTHDLWKSKFPDFSNPRNAASGIAKRETRADAQDCQYLTVMAFDFHSEMVDISNEEEKFFFLKNELGFKVPNHGFNRTVDALGDLYTEYESTLRSELHYDIDGLVIRLQDASTFEGAGLRGGNPYGAVALKFESMGAVTTLRDVVWQTGNTGRITPVAEFDTVEIGGANISRATLHNISNIDALQLCIGDTILVVRANDVIPQVKRVIENYKTGDIVDAKYEVIPPSTCPACDVPVNRDGEYLVCRNEACPATCLGKLAQWVDELGLKGWGDVALDAVIKAGLVEDLPDLYQLLPQDLEDLEKGNGARFGWSWSSTLVNELHTKSASITLATLVGGIGMEGIRSSTIQKIIDAGYTTWESMCAITVGELRSISGIGESTAENFLEGVHLRKDVIDTLLRDGYVSLKKPSAPSDRVTCTPLPGTRFALTGSMSKVRGDIEQDIIQAGGQVGSVSSKTDYVVAADPTSNSSKLKKARREGIPIISEKELYDMLK